MNKKFNSKTNAIITLILKEFCRA